MEHYNYQTILKLTLANSKFSARVNFVSLISFSVVGGSKNKSKKLKAEFAQLVKYKLVKKKRFSPSSNISL